MKLLFMGTPDFAVPTLQALIDADHEVVAVYSQPPRPSGRGHKLTPSPVQRLAEAHGVPVFTPASLKSDEAQHRFRAHGADIAVVAAYGLILPQAILDACPKGCINVHPSDLPRWRGAAPIQRTILAGDTETAMCIMQMDAGLDTGDVLFREPYTIPDGMTAGELHDVMASKGAQAILNVLNSYDSLTPQPQQGEPTYAAKVTKADAVIDWNQPAAAILNHIRGLNPYPAARATIGREEVKIFNARHCEEANPSERWREAQSEPEKADEAIHLASPWIAASNASRFPRNDILLYKCGDGQFLEITELQRPGKKRMSTAEALKGWKI